MKIIDVPGESSELAAILAQARQEDLIVRSSDGSEFLLTAVDDFDRELALARRNRKLMELLDERAKQAETIPLREVRRRLGLDE